MYTCIECGRERSEDQMTSNPPGVCLSCKLDSFGGVTYRGIHKWGRSNWHDDMTVAAYEREIHAGAAANGVPIDRPPS